MSLVKIDKLLAFILFVTTIIFSCTLRTTKMKNPIFGKNEDSLQKTLYAIVAFEGIELNGKEINSNGKINSGLEVDIINAQNITNNKDQVIALGKLIASTIKKALKDQNEYDDYTVLFVTKVTNDGVTQKSWEGKMFKSEELP